MYALHRARAAFVEDLTRTRHMLAVSAVIMGATFIPLFGGLPRASEWSELHAVLSGGQDRIHNAQDASAAQLEPRAERGSVQMRRAALEDGESELTTLELQREPELDPTLLGPEDVPMIEEDAAELDELPVLEEIEPEAIEEAEPIAPSA